MNIRRFRAHSVTEALAMVKAELGDDAVILNTARHRIRDRAAGTSDSMVEVVAAVDFDSEELVRQETGRPGQGRAGTDAGAAVLSSGCGEGEAPCSRPSAPAMEGADDYNLRDEIKQLREMVEKMTGMRDYSRETHACPMSGACDDRYHPGPMLSSARYPLMVIHEVFDLLGMDAAMQKGLAACFLRSAPADRPVNHRAVYAWLRQYFTKHIAQGPLAHSSDRPCWWAFIGPTGVGKTTTLAKVAAHLKFRHGLKGCLVTVDTYRLGGVEQLEKYADLMEIPFATAKNTGELVKIFSDNREMDFILVDTIGRNSRSSRHHVELEKIFSAVPGLAGQALLCAAYRTEDMIATVRTYRKFPVCGWTISKIDETDSRGGLYTPIIDWKLPLSYITHGQKVPEDIKPASRDNILEILFRRGDAFFQENPHYRNTAQAEGRGRNAGTNQTAFIGEQR